MAGRLPLSALLSQALVAFTIEADNEAEHRLPHRTQDYGLSAGAATDAPWQTSLVMWANCLRHVPDDGITVAGMRAAARTGTNLDGMRRWRYVTYTPDPGRGKRPRPDAVRAPDPRRPAGARRVGRRARRDRAALARHASARPRWTACAPRSPPWSRNSTRGCRTACRSCGFGLLSKPDLPDGATTQDPATLPLWALLSRTLLAFATEFEDDSGRSLAISANLLRVLTEDGVRSRDVPALAGISKAAVAFTMGPATKQGLVAEQPDPAGSRWKISRLTSPGARAQRAYADLTAAVEDRWRSRFGAERVAALRDALEPLAVGDPPPLFGGLTPYEDGWRARVKAPAVLPHYPMVLHRGGYPDGA